jgi:hypothetical protein
MTDEEREEQANAYARGMWGAKLVMVSLGFSILSLLLIPLFYIALALTKVVIYPILQLAGILGVIHWALGAIGTGFCVAGLIPQGYYRFAISAAVAVLIHMILLLGVVAQPRVADDGRVHMDETAVVWYQVPTQYHQLTFYLGSLLYADSLGLLRTGTPLGFVTGVAEMCRLILILLTLSALSQAAGDNELAHRCTRIAGRASFVPLTLSLAMLLGVAALIETGAVVFAATIFALLIFMGIYLVPAFVQVTALAAARDVADACEFPFQSNPIHFGG